MGKGEIIKILKEIGVLLELKGENAFKVRAYQSGARTLERLEDNFEQIVEAGRLKELKGIGQALVQKIELLYREGRLPFYEDLKASVAPGLLEFLEIPGLGGKKVKVIYDQLGIDTMDALKEACTSGTIEALEGFGKKSAEKILSGIENRKAYGKRHLWWSVTDLVERILDILRAHPSTIRAEVAGSYRRCMETVGDLDFIVASESASELMELFVALEGVKEVTAKGITKSSVRFESGIQADLRVVPEEAFVFALHHFTGSKDHNVLMKQRALSMGYRLSEWGIFNKNSDDAEPLKVSSEIQSECDLFKFFKLSPIVPELREGFDEVSRAEASNMPSLVQASSIKGVFHNHTTASDGLDTLEDMVKAAERLGWSYIGFADHSKASYQANGLSEDRVLKLIDSIKQFNESKQSKVKVFSGIECDILSDGRLDLEQSVLEQLDYVVASVHSGFTQSESEMTQRIIKAIEQPVVTMLGHPTGRLLLRREAYAVNIDKIIDAAIANKVIIEINANPQRLDMDWRHWRKGLDRGLLCSINPDAHSTQHLDYFRAGVNIARKAGMEDHHIINTRNVSDVSLLFTEGY
tara:strand:- start:218 stop:1960 length:1743 start_codon:yes stop_codon:yes gene_type:complete